MKSSSTGGLLFLLALISSIGVLQAEEGGKSPLTKRTKARGAILGGQNTKLVRDAPAAEGAASTGKSASKRVKAIAIDVFGTCAKTDRARPVPSCGDDEKKALEWFLNTANHPTGFEMNNENWMMERLTLALFQVAAQVPIITPGWMTISDHCTWQGVVCAHSDGTLDGDMITSLDLHGNSLRGTIPSEIASLANLKTLDLHGNQLGGTIPLEIGNMASLTYLDLSYNHDLQLTVTSTPSSFCNTLVDCVLPTLFNKLQAIAIDVFGTCAESLPSTCGDDKNQALEWFLIIANHPPGFEMNNENWMMERLTLALFKFAAHVVVPSSTSGWMTIFDHCTWQGVVCAPSGTLDGNMITSLDLHGNNLTGTVPSEIASLANLRTLYLNENNLRGTIPSEIATLANLSTLYLNENQFGGNIPLEIGNMASLTFLNLSDNHDLQLTIPTSRFCIITPYCVLPTPHVLDTLKLIAIDVFGTCAELSCGYDKSEALEWFLNINNHPPGFETNNINWMRERLILSLFQIVAQVPISTPGWMTISDHCTWQGVYCAPSGALDGDMITELYMVDYGNVLTGTIPSEIASLANLTYLFLGVNQLGGTIPSEIATLANLMALDLSRNNLTGTIPLEIATLANLMALDLSRNNLTGTIPLEIGNMASLKHLDLGGNPYLDLTVPTTSFCNTIPYCSIYIYF